MEYSKIVALSGLTGLFELISTKSDGAVVRSVEDGTTKFASSRIHNFSHLESIEIYTTGDNVNLVKIFEAIKASNEALPDTKDNKALVSYFEKVFPELDFERVYASDQKKIIKWYDLLTRKNVEIVLTPVEDEDAEEAAPEEEKEPVAEELPKSKKGTKK